MTPEPETRDALVVAIALGIVMTLGDLTALIMQKQERQDRKQVQTSSTGP